jgi:hypothetical protein
MVKQKLYTTKVLDVLNPHLTTIIKNKQECSITSLFLEQAMKLGGNELIDDATLECEFTIAPNSFVRQDYQTHVVGMLEVAGQNLDLFGLCQVHIELFQGRCGFGAGEVPVFPIFAQQPLEHTSVALLDGLHNGVCFVPTIVVVGALQLIGLTPAKTKPFAGLCFVECALVTKLTCL